MTEQKAPPNPFREKDAINAASDYCEKHGGHLDVGNAFLAGIEWAYQQWGCKAPSPNDKT